MIIQILKKKQSEVTGSTIVFNNQLNPFDLVDYVAELNLTTSNFDFDLYDATPNILTFKDGNTPLSYYVDGYDSVNKKIRLFLKLTILKNTQKTIAISYTNTHTNNYLSILNRKSIIASTTRLYTCASVLDSNSVGSNLITNGSINFASNNYGNVADIAGGYLTLADELPITCGRFSFSFVLKDNHTVGGGAKTIYIKAFSSTSFIALQLLNNGKMRLDFGPENWTSTQIYWPKDQVHTLSFRVNRYTTICKLDNNYILEHTTIRTAGGLPHTWGVLNLQGYALSQYCNLYVFDIEYGLGDYSLKLENARNKGINIFNDTELNKWDALTEVNPSYPAGEPSILSVGPELWLYNGKYQPGVNDSWQERRKSTDGGVTWGTPEVVTGIGTSKDRSFVFKDEDKYIMLNREGLMAESDDGLNFTNQTQYLPQTYGVTHNSFMFKDDDGVYKGICDKADSVTSLWNMLPFSGLDKRNVSYAFGGHITSTDSNDGYLNIAGGAFVKKINGIYHLWCHSYLPSAIFRYTNVDILADSWIKKYQNEALGLDIASAIDQKADVSICEHDGALYLACSNNDNNMDNLGSLDSTISIYKFQGSFEDLVNDLIITINK